MFAIENVIGAMPLKCSFKIVFLALKYDFIEIRDSVVSALMRFSSRKSAEARKFYSKKKNLLNDDYEFMMPFE